MPDPVTNNIADIETINRQTIRLKANTVPKAEAKKNLKKAFMYAGI
jgi:hypothetical protein